MELTHPKYLMRHFLRSFFRRSTARVGDAQLCLDLLDAKVSPSMCLPWPLRFEWREQQCLRSAIRPGQVAVDVGAHIGYHFILMAQLVGARGRVIGFEPSERNFQFLQLNFQLNRLNGVIASNVEIKQCALWDSPCEKVLYVSEQNTGNCTLSPQPNRKQVVVHCERLDDLLAGQPIDFMKMDVEGAEIHVLRGATETLRKSPNLRLMIEVNPPYLTQMGGTAEELLQILESNGFHMYEVHNRRRELKAGDVRAICKSAPDAYANLFCVKGTGAS